VIAGTEAGAAGAIAVTAVLPLAVGLVDAVGSSTLSGADLGFRIRAGAEALSACTVGVAAAFAFAIGLGLALVGACLHAALEALGAGTEAGMLPASIIFSAVLASTAGIWLTGPHTSSAITMRPFRTSPSTGVLTDAIVTPARTAAINVTTRAIFRATARTISANTTAIFRACDNIFGPIAFAIPADTGTAILRTYGAIVEFCITSAISAVRTYTTIFRAIITIFSKRIATNSITTKPALFERFH